MTQSSKLFAPAIWSGKIFDGDWKDARGAIQEVLDKASGDKIAESAFATKDDVSDVARVAVEAQKEWCNLPGPQRGDILRKFSELCRVHDGEISDWLVRETGSVRAKADWEVHTTAREVLEASTMPSFPQGQLLATEVPGRQSIARRLPVGVVGIITPWNSPFLLAARAFGPALAMGNAVVIKPDPQTPIIGGVLPALLLEEAGLPKGLFQVVPGGAETGEAIISDPAIDMISFTGSTATGRIVGEQAGHHIKRVSLELGGNNAYIVLDDADLEAATSAGSFGSFFHQGQICLTAGRHLVHEVIAEEYIQRLAERTQRLKIGDPFLDNEVLIGPIINQKQADRVEGIVQRSIDMGATLNAGGMRDGLYYPPTVLSDVTVDMPVFTDEIFGPVAPVITFKTDEEAVQLANQTHYGLSAAIQSPDIGRAMAIADQLHSGIIHINEQTVLHEVYGPIGGVGASGNGFNYGTVSNADKFTELQWITSRAEAQPYPF